MTNVWFSIENKDSEINGKRLRAWLALTHRGWLDPAADYHAAMEADQRAGLHTSLHMRVKTHGSEPSFVMLTAPYTVPVYRDPEVPPALSDLSYEINEDIVEALDAHFNGTYYAGVDEGIEPMPDEHVALVIWGLQRELNRELRYGRGGDGLATEKPAPQLAELLAPAIQRALAERRRLRYQQFGIGRKQWEENSWSLWDIPEEPDFFPRQLTRKRLLAENQEVAALPGPFPQTGSWAGVGSDAPDVATDCTSGGELAPWRTGHPGSFWLHKTIELSSLWFRATQRDRIPPRRPPRMARYREDEATRAVPLAAHCSVRRISRFTASPTGVRSTCPRYPVVARSDAKPVCWQGNTATEAVNPF